MTNPDPDETHDIADTQMFRRFVNEQPPTDTEAAGFWQRLRVWPMLLVPVIGSIVIVVVLIILFT